MINWLIHLLTCVVKFFNKSHVDGHDPLLLLAQLVPPTRPDRPPPIHPFVELPPVDVGAIALPATMFALLLAPSPGGGPRAGLFDIGAPHNSDDGFA